MNPEVLALVSPRREYELTGVHITKENVLNECLDNIRAWHRVWGSTGGWFSDCQRIRPDCCKELVRYTLKLILGKLKDGNRNQLTAAAITMLTGTGNHKSTKNKKVFPISLHYFPMTVSDISKNLCYPTLSRN